MSHPLRSTVGVAVLAGALVFSGSAAHAQTLETVEPILSSPADVAPVLVQAPEPATTEADTAAAPVVPFVQDTNGAVDAGNVEPEAPSVDIEAASDGVASVGLAPTDAEEASDEVGDVVEPVESEGADTAVDETVVADAAHGEGGAEEKITPGVEAAPVGGGIEVPVVLHATGPGSRTAAVPTSDSAVESDVEAEEEVNAEPEPVLAATSKVPGSDLFEFPKESTDWSEGQWEDWTNSEAGGQWLNENVENLVQAMETDAYLDYFDAVAPFLIDGDLAGLLAFLEAEYPDDLILAQFMVGVVAGELLAEGVIDDLDFFLDQLPPEEGAPVAPVQPTEESTEEVVIKPIANLTTPKAPAAKPVLKIRPITLPAVAKVELAETGATAAGFVAGAGGTLLLAGVGILLLRRRKQA